MLWNQYRRVDAGRLSIEDLDMSIEVENPKDSEHMFEVVIWNLSEASWRMVNEEDYCRIVLGWEEGGNTENVMHGLIEKKWTQADGNDMEYHLKGTEASEHITKQRLSVTFDDTLTPNEIASQLAGEVGLTTGSVGDVPSNVAKKFPVKKDKPVRHWFDELVKEAEKLTGSGWEWFVDGGRFYFVEKNGEKEDAVSLSYDNTLVSINEADTEAEGDDGLVFEAMMEPRIRKGAAVEVDTDEYSGAYKVTEYTFNSNTTTGDHSVEGRLSPLDMDYEPRTSRYERGSIQGGNVRPI